MDRTASPNFLAATPSLAYAGACAPPSTRRPRHRTSLVAARQHGACALAGIGLAAFLYLGDRGAGRLALRAAADGRLYQLSYGKFFFDPIYSVLDRLAAAAAGAAELLVRSLRDRRPGESRAAGCPLVVGAVLRPLQTGMVQFYALAMVLGRVVLIGHVVDVAGVASNWN